jgi:histidinol-phosphate/aromatic aminotransferase/cobyric acid decarboxylase-like protein
MALRTERTLRSSSYELSYTLPRHHAVQLNCTFAALSFHTIRFMGLRDAIRLSVPQLANRMQRIGGEGAFEVLVRARALGAAGRDIVHLEIGEPDFPTPSNIVAAAKRALDDGWTHYGPTQGLPELRDTIAHHICRTRQIKVGPEHVCVVPGGKPIIFFPMMALLEPGDEVIYPNPGFPI